jgi:hypothetical protein
METNLIKGLLITFAFAPMALAQVTGGLTSHAPGINQSSQIKLPLNVGDLVLTENSSISSGCIGGAITQATGLALWQMRNISVRMTGESLHQPSGNYVWATDRVGNDILTNKPNLPYYESSGNVMLDIQQPLSNDLCLRVMDDGTLEDFILYYEVGNTGPIGPIPGQSIEGKIGTVIANMGDYATVYGWACDTAIGGGQALPVYLYVDGQYIESEYASVNVKLTSDKTYFGQPSFACGPVSGYRLRFPVEAYMNKRINIEVRTKLQFSNVMQLVSSLDYKMPFQPKTEGIFNVGQDFYYLYNDLTTYCHISHPDQLKAGINRGYRQYGNLGQLPGGFDFQGVCPMIQYPKGLFKATNHSSQMIFFSDGATYCHVQHPGQLKNIEWAYQLSGRTDYSNLPGSDVMASTGTCKVAGLFRINGGEEVYESNGLTSYCHVPFEHMIAGRPVFNYEAAPQGLEPAGTCPVH